MIDFASAVRHVQPRSAGPEKERSMKNGYFHQTGNFAPETAIGTGALQPLVDEVEAAEAA